MGNVGVFEIWKNPNDRFRIGMFFQNSAFLRIHQSILQVFWDSSVAEATSQGRVRSSVRRGDGGMVGGTPGRFADGSGDRTAPRGCKGLSIDDNSCRGGAPVDSKPENSSFCAGEHSEVILYQCGLLGIRVGEASHPGPVKTRSARRLERSRRRVASSSDDEPLVRPVVGREVIPRIEAGADLLATGGEATVPDSVIDALEADLTPPVPSTVPVSDGRFLQLGLLCGVPLSEPGPTQWESGAEFPLERRAPDWDSNEEVEREEVPPGRDGVFDMTVADSPDEIDVDEEAQPVRGVFGGRRVVLVPQSGTPRSVHDRSDAGSNREVGENESDIDSLDFLEENGSVVSGVAEGTPAAFREALQAIDEVNLNMVFQRRANVMKSVPHILTGPYRNAMKVLLEEVLAGHERGDILRQERGWKAFMLLPRLLFHRKCRGGKVGKEKLRERFDAFRAGRWASLLTASVEHDEEAARIATRKRRTHQHGDLEHRIGRDAHRVG